MVIINFPEKVLVESVSCTRLIINRSITGQSAMRGDFGIIYVFTY